MASFFWDTVYMPQIVKVGNFIHSHSQSFFIIFGRQEIYNKRTDSRNQNKVCVTALPPVANFLYQVVGL